MDDNQDKPEVQSEQPQAVQPPSDTQAPQNQAQQPVAAQAGQASATESAPAAAEGQEKEKSTSGKPQILLAEDEDDARVIYLDILKGQPFDVDASANGKETLQKLEGKVYDLVLLDIIMPDMDGITVLTEIKNFPAKYGTPKVVMLTNIGGDLAIEKALDIGANGYMLKSETEPDELIRIIKKYLAGEDHVKLEKTIMDAA